ncbi:MAG: PLDc N-terminal domain-containing protein [Deltaproteobacteria bacterium]|jgi:cardiolipin synthase|nr:PLDc N-terminal domain-containing protein [Deltaproteobacteria bacterium]MBW2535267.1 PLDc N-terminal domain-containing protein [Deltaproteobacteria bacterium]
MPIEELLRSVWPYALSAASALIAVLASAHVVLNKRDVRGTIAWVGFIWALPIAGAALYAMLGINRIRRKARILRPEQHVALEDLEPHSRRPGDLDERARPLVRLVDRMVHHRLVAGNRVRLLRNGDEAFPAMLEAIDDARRSVTLATYIFDNDRAGKRFCEALVRAKQRGVQVRVLIDDFGTMYSWPPITRELERADVPLARFLPTLVPWRMQYVNLRNHRKLCVVDGRIGFTGGMNIREGNLLELRTKHATQDVHARIEGPVVAHLQQAFSEDWHFSTGQELQGERFFPPLAEVGSVTARGLPDGPDEDFEVLRMTMIGALSVAKRRVAIVTPYFVPDGALITALNVAAMRGARVDIVLPARGNLALVHWACMGTVGQVLEHGCRVWLTPPPFDHTKLMVVDGSWTLLGSANWDMRTLRLNFEFNIECYDEPLAELASELIEQRLQGARRLTMKQIQTRSLPVRLRDGAARLLSPYL